MCQDSTSLPHLPGLVLGWLVLALDTEQRASLFPSSDLGVFFKMDFISKGKTIINIVPFIEEVKTSFISIFLRN